MDKEYKNRLAGNRRGNMPFAFVAVTILLVASAYCVTAASARETESDAEVTSDEMSVLGNAAEATASFVDMGLGEIIYEMCTSSDGGNLQERNREFKILAAKWLEFQFPVSDSGVTATLIEHSLSLHVEKMKLDASVTDLEGYVPSYMKAAGTVTVEFESEAGRSTRTIEISTDGSCALPLALETGSLFDNALTGGGSVLYQMINYQLTSLAQYRVINGYGAFNQYGAKGTESILTESDVRQAYTGAVRALECLYFRDDAGNEYRGDTDLASRLVEEEEAFTVNLNSIYAQALYSQMDRIIGKWFDYFLGNVLLTTCDQISDALKNAWDSLVSFMTGKNNFSAEPYMRKILGDLDTSLRSGQSFPFKVVDPETGESATYYIPYPTVDLYSSSIITDFKSDYRANTNSIREWITSVVNKAISRIADGKGMWTVTFANDASRSFSDNIDDAVLTALEGNLTSFDTVTREVLSSDRFPDQFYAAIYHSIQSNRNSLFTCNTDSFKGHTVGYLDGHIINDFFPAEGEDLYAMEERILDASFGLEENRQIIRDYQAEVEWLMERMSALEKVECSDSSLVKEACIGMLEAGLLTIDCTSAVKVIARGMCQEFKTNMEVNPYCGILNLPESDVFTLSGEKVYKEKITVTDDFDPVITVGSPNSRSSHETGFQECAAAPFCTVIPVTIHDRLTYRVTTAGTLLQALGMWDSAYGDTLDIDICTEISVVSGWGLQGVEYTSSTNVLQDLYEVLLNALEPLLEPLRKIMSMAESLMDKLSQAIMIVSQYIQEIVEMIYNAVMEPVERLQRFFTETVTETFCEQIVRIAEGAEAIIDVSLVNQTLGFTYMGYTLKFTFNLSSLEKYTKYIVKAEFSGSVNGIDINAFVNIRTKGEDRKIPYINAGFTLKGDDWDLEATIDPTMTTNKNLVSISGIVNGVKIDAVLPEAVQYNEIGIKLSDFPGIGTILSNLPSPIVGTKLDIDAGISLKYNLPVVTGVLINEFESNPEGTDANHEWVEILNLSGTSVDLNNWTLTTSKKKVHIIKDVKLNPGERTVICFPGTFLVNSKEYLILKDPDGMEIDRSATMSDSYNNGKTCQRAMDGSTEWSMLDGTQGAANKGGIFGTNGVLGSVVKDIVKTAAVKAMTELKHVYTTEQLQELFVRTVKYAVNDGIERISNSVVSGSVYVSVDFTDLVSANRTGFTVYVMVDSDLVGDILKYILGKAEALFLNIDDPYNIDIDSVMYDDVYLGISVYAGYSLPSILCANKLSETKVLLGVDISCNLSAIGSLLDCDLGTPRIKAQIGIRNCPYEMIPKALGMKKNMTYDYWLIRMTFTFL